MSRRGPRITTALVTAALLAAAAPTVALNAPPADPRTTGKTAEPEWMRALRIRSEALNRIHGLAGGQSGWELASMRALQIRSEALNQMYGVDGAG